MVKYWGLEWLLLIQILVPNGETKCIGNVTNGGLNLCEP